MDESLKEKSIKGFIWNAIERYSTMAVMFVSQVLIARRLVPEDYGVVGMISIFLGLSYIFIDSGFGTALVQKKNNTQSDYSTVFFFNVSVALFFYIVLFICAPFIADFYHEPLLIPVTRIVSIGVVLNSLVTVQYSILYSKMDYKTMSIASIMGNCFSAVVGLSMAYSGFGMWSLVSQNIAKLTVTVSCLWLKSTWRPSFTFSWGSIKVLWPFGSRLLAAGVINTIFDNLYQVVIGKFYSKRDLGLYSKSTNYSQMPMKATASLLNGLVFPALCSVQDDKERMAYVYRKYLRMAVFIVFPVMFGMTSIARPLVILLLTEKWVGIVPLIQILCMATMWGPVHSINNDLLLAKGRSDLSFRLNNINKIITIVAIIIFFPLGLIGMCFAQLSIALLTLVVNTHYTGIFLGLNFWKQMRDVFPALVLSSIMAIIVYGVTFFIPSNLLKVIIGVMVGVLYIYFGASLFKIKERDDVLEILKNKIINPLLRKK